MKRRIVQIIFTLASLCLLAGCQKDNSVKINSAEVGQWHLVQWNGAEPENFDIYLELLSDGTFNLYQRLQSSDYSHFNGTFSLDGGYLSGVYDDGALWTTKYSYSLGGANNSSLTLRSCDAQAIESVYERAEIPSDVRSGLFGR